MEVQVSSCNAKFNLPIPVYASSLPVHHEIKMQYHLYLRHDEDDQRYAHLT